MRYYDYEMDLLIKECEEFLYCMEEHEVENNCGTEEQMLINAVSNVVLAYSLLRKRGI